jgi:prepilin-type N-terminal cleavage/methylation domain-containing protein
VRRTQAGFTLIELMISLVLFSFAIAGVLAIAVSMTQGFREQRQAVTTETSSRVPLDFLADALRQASPAVPDFTKVQDSITGSIGALSMTNSTSGPDRLDVIYASGGIVTSAAVAYNSFDTTMTVTDASQLSNNDYLLISNLNYGHVVKIQSKAGNVLTLWPMCSTNQVSQSYPIGSLVIRVQHSTFTIGADAQDGQPTLMMDPDSDGKEWDGTAAPCQSSGSAVAEPLAEGVEDMQIAFGIDSGTDGVSEIGASANDDEWIPNVSGESLPTALSGFTGTLRAVRVTLIARSDQALVGGASGGVTLYRRPAAEDHAQGALDAYRRRVLRTIVEVRNTGVSP